MNYSIELTPEEISILRQSLDVITIQGKSAKLVSTLQDKLDDAIFQIKMNIEIQEQEKQSQLQELVNKSTKRTVKS